MAKIAYIVTLSGTINAFFVSQINYLTNNGFEVAVITNESTEYSKKLSDKVRKIKVDIPRGISIWKSLISLISLYRIFKKEKFDIIQYSTPNAALCASLAGVLAHMHVRNYHMMGFRYLGFSGYKRQFFKFIEKVTCFLSTDIECVSNGNMQLGIDGHFFCEKKTVVVWNGSTGGINRDRFDIKKREEWRKGIRNNLGIGPEKFVFLFAGRFTRDKGISELLKAFMKIKKHEVQLLLVGFDEGMNKTDPEMWTKAQNALNITIRPNVLNIEEYYAAADCLVLPSYREGFGTVIIEAACVGTPSIATDIPGPSEIIGHIGGLLCKPKSVTDLYKKMIEASESFGKLSSNEIAEKVLRFYDQDTLNQKILERKLFLLTKTSHT